MAAAHSTSLHCSAYIPPRALHLGACCILYSIVEFYVHGGCIGVLKPASFKRRKPSGVPAKYVHLLSEAHPGTHHCAECTARIHGGGEGVSLCLAPGS